MHSHVGWYVCTSRILPAFIYSCFICRFFLECSEHDNAAVSLIVIVHICNIFEIYFFSVKCANMILTTRSSLMLLPKGNSMTAEVPTKQQLNQVKTVGC